MRWKDFLYYYRWEQLAIGKLLVLILVALILNLSLTLKKPSQVIINQNDSLIAAFDSFYNGLAEAKKSVEIRQIKNELLSESRTKNSYDNRRSNFTPRSVKLTAGEKISLNNSDTTEWKKVPGIGSVFATRIVKYRDLLGGFVAADQLLEVYGMDNERFAGIIDYIEIDKEIDKIKINKLEFKELLKHPYLNYNQVQAIVNLRKKKGDIQSINELSILKEFTNDDILRLEAYLEF